MLNSKTCVETERKFLIKMPDISLIESQNGIRAKRIIQTYLKSLKSSSTRVRKTYENGIVTYTHTVKRRISAMSSFENERKISSDEYDKLLLLSDPLRDPICKTRYAIPYDSHVFEVDIYDFWNDRAILEVELLNEKENFVIPSYIDVIKEVTEDYRYKNSNLAYNHIFEVIK